MKPGLTYGAFRLGLAQPEHYSCIVSLSDAIALVLQTRKTSVQMEDVFGDQPMDHTGNDNLWKLEQLIKQGGNSQNISVLRYGRFPL